MAGPKQIGTPMSRRGGWETPQLLFEELDREFGFTLDAAASPHNAKCPTYFTEQDDGLTQPWIGRVWLNPPYGRQIGRWVEKCYASVMAEVVVALLPVSTGSQWWQDSVMRADEIRLIRGRLHFELDGKPLGPANFDSALAIWRRKPNYWRTWVQCWGNAANWRRKE